MSEYIRSLGFVPCEFGCGGWVHPNPSDPNARQSVRNHICIPKLKKVLDDLDNEWIFAMTRWPEGAEL